MAKKRTVMRSSAGKKLYAVRDAQGKFEDIQTYQRAQAADMRHTSKAELEKKAKAKKSAKAKSSATKKTAKKAKPAKRRK